VGKRVLGGSSFLFWRTNRIAHDKLHSQSMCGGGAVRRNESWGLWGALAFLNTESIKKKKAEDYISLISRRQSSPDRGVYQGSVGLPRVGEPEGGTRHDCAT